MSEDQTRLQFGKLLAMSGDPHGVEFHYEVRAGRVVHPKLGILTSLPIIVERSRISGDRRSVIAIDPDAVVSVRDGLVSWLKLASKNQLNQCFKDGGYSRSAPATQRVVGNRGKETP